MRLLPLISAVLLLSISSTLSPVTSASADEAKYKGRPKPPSEPQDREYKRPPNQPQRPPDPPKPPAERPPSKERPIKPPPEHRRPDEPKRPPDPPPPPPRPHPYPPCPPPPPPVVYPCPDPDPPIIYPWPDPPVVVRDDSRAVLTQRLRMLEIDGFDGEVLVGHNDHVEFDRRGGFDTRHEIGAVTQAFTAWAIYRLIDSKRLSPKTRIEQVFGDVPDDKRFITIEQLLRHTSGLGNTYAGEGETDRRVAVHKLLAQPLVTGDAFHYSEDGYVLLAAVIESVTSRDYESFLYDSGVVSHDMKKTSELENLDWGVRGTGGMLSSARDLFVWTSNFLVSEERMEITQPRAWTEDGVGLGYGWIRTGEAPQLLQTSAAMENGENVVIVVYPLGTILVVTSDGFNGDVPWSERVANEVEPILRSWRPADPPRRNGPQPLLQARSGE